MIFEPVGIFLTVPGSHIGGFTPGANPASNIPNLNCQQEPLLVKDRSPLGAPLFDLLSGRRHLRLGAFWRRQNGGDDVMDDPAIAGARFGNLHILVFGEAWINHEVLILVRPISVEGELFRHL
jgi:hypothetical protein